MLYLDTSATAKLLVEGAEGRALVDFLRAASMPLVTRRVGIVELRRIGRRIDAGADRTDALTPSLVVIELDERIERQGIELDPGPRSLDAIHLATAVAAADSIDGFVCYDLRLGAGVGRRGPGVTTILLPATGGAVRIIVAARMALDAW